MQSEGSKRKGSGYGVKNIEKRLELYLVIPPAWLDEPDEGGTCVTIDVPVVRSESGRRRID